MERYLIDTNIVSDYLSASFSEEALRFMDEIIDAVPNVSIISQIELLCWKTDTSTTSQVKKFINDSNILNIDQRVIKECVALRRSRKVKTPDAIIAGTALAYGCALITNNEKDFQHIKNLKIVNPHKF